MHSLPMYERLIDSRTGLITQLMSAPLHPNLPRQIRSWRARVADGLVLAGMPSDRIAGGTYFDDERARLAAIGEAVERYSGNFIAGPLIKGSYNELKPKGYSLLDPQSIPLYSLSQYAAKGFPFVPMSRELPIHWVEGLSLTRNKRIWLPASLVYINYYYGKYAQEPPTNFVNYAGISCGASLDAAITSGLLEVIERDAVAIWWGSGVALPALDTKTHPHLLSYLEPANPASPVSFKWFPLPLDLGIPVIGSLLYDASQEIVCMGFAARFSASDAALKAAAETAQSYHIALDLLEPDSPTWRAIETGILNSKALKPYRSDRSYLQAFRSDYRDMVDLYLNSQYYMDPATHNDIRYLLDAKETASLPLEDSSASTWKDLVQRLAERNLEAFYVDLTTPDVRDVGLSVTRVLVPGLVPNAPTAFPYLGPSRQYSIPYELGWCEHPLTEASINRRPLPHS